MRYLLLLLVVLALPAQARTITDSAGRVVEIPDEVNTVFAAGPPASILVYIMKPEALTGWPRALRPAERDYIAAPYRDIPETGRITGRGGEANLERVLEIQPDLIIDFGSVRDTYVDLANRVQEQTDIPYILIDGRFENTPAALRLLGEALGVPERGEELAADVEATFARIDAILENVPEEERPRVYLARGPEGLETGMKGSINTEIIERAGGRNVADDGGTTRGLVQASMEQVIVANPDTIVTWDPNFYGSAFDDPLWQGIDAVRDGRVYLSPTAPFGWIDRPPSLNRMIGLIWMAGLLYPDQWQGDLREDTRAFYELYYHVDLTEEELERLLEWAEGRPPM
ncbi:ABC transporter substrate-binding protein [Roseobacter sp. HKCCD9010]|uniref:iron ABC transporter substrate-binding protein n=1 Tax=unclassified Roseobacter TaxID=196798 RepID=UPI0014918462|nr:MULTISPECIES: iron ABC transporter substrate-binding protein [unclassified Roseobacter]MBF9051966.1 ABC transporter substrate-binding protein [Rhodobacterales bacterium HKCCD4356]NNV10311.1 ABC transporter substrate-binding protein [Roseobacter sp. HKCCD7357]NNV18131.1 ABC transporter substrate-binding protein [Roseobacter sp. HKCCD8768]NNV27591.1 ABC transporter substrate-binding protein [Roseobacter sp. HKCCD8192]NNV31857.1 ABC transporter substrate-binding protein [Roseobacter sp. HKCCD9